MLTELLNDHENLFGILRKDIGHQEDHSDLGTIDFLTGILEQQESTAWILRRYLSCFKLLFNYDYCHVPIEKS
jgi:starvation-inducible DNA-binding protein